MAYLETMGDLLEGWPADAPDLNPIENVRAFLKIRVGVKKPLTKGEPIDVIIAA
jgi:hypothetical protein